MSVYAYGVQLLLGRVLESGQTIAQQQHATLCAAQQHTDPPRRRFAATKARTSEIVRCVVTSGRRGSSKVSACESHVKRVTDRDLLIIMQKSHRINKHHACGGEIIPAESNIERQGPTARHTPVKTSTF
jgi:hypothetical protein